MQDQNNANAESAISDATPREAEAIATIGGAEIDADSEPVTAHVLFLDIVDSTIFPTDEQPQILKRLSEIVRNTDSYRNALAKNQLLRIPTGDGMALVFFTETPIPPVRCALQVSSSLRSMKANFGLRMGIHTGPVYRLHDIDDKANVNGDGINLASRVMSCGDAGHIMVSGPVADYLSQLKEWSGLLHDLKEVRIKKTKLRPFNLYNKEAGNPRVPKPVKDHRRRHAMNISAIAFGALLLILSGVLAYTYIRGRVVDNPSRDKIQSIAVLTLTGGDASLADVSKGLTHEIIEGISAISPADLVVKPDPKYPFQNVQLSPTADVREAGQLLNAQAVLNGKIEFHNNTYSITFELVDVRNNVPIWPPKTYSVPPQSTHSIADLISSEVVKSLRGDTSGAVNKEAPSRSPNAVVDDEAKDLYIAAINLLEKRNKAEIQLSIDKLNAAVRRSPQYAEAWASLAEAYNICSGYGIGTPFENYEKARRAATRARELAPGLPEAHVALAYTLANYDFDWAAAEAEFKQADNLRPNSPATQYAYAFQYLVSQGRMDEAIEWMEKARDNSPLSVIINANLGWTYYYAGKYDLARQQYQRTLQIDPKSTRARRRLMELYETTKEYDKAIEEYIKLYSEKEGDRLRKALARGEASYWDTRIAQVEEQAARNKEQIPKYDLALLYASRGNNELAIKYLQEAVVEKSDGIIKVGVNPRFRNIRSDPRFIEIVNDKVKVRMSVLPT